jgi:hypothetical protein
MCFSFCWLIEPVEGMVVAVQAVCVVKAVPKKGSPNGQPYREAVLDPLELVVAESFEELRQPHRR